MEFKNKLPLYYQDCDIKNNLNDKVVESEKRERFILTKVTIFTPITQSNLTTSSIFYKTISKIL